MILFVELADVVSGVSTNSPHVTTRLSTRLFMDVQSLSHSQKHFFSI